MTIGEPAPRSAYVHVPFCAHRCGYCDFTVVAGRLDLVDDYLKAIELETCSQGPPTEVDTLYFGGGTPSQLSHAAFERLCDLALAWHPLAAEGEWTVEANPADVTDEWIAQLVSRGVTRLSLGGQSFRNDKLRFLERDHQAAEIDRCVSLAKTAGIEVCLDLIFGVPGESLAHWKADLAAALALDPEHISTYGLTIEKGTSFWNRRAQGALHEVSDERQRDMYVTAIEMLCLAGYQHYEVSNFAQPGHRSRHNQTYWAGDGCFAVGPGATRYVNGRRETNHRSTTSYLRRVLAGKSPVSESEHLSPEQRAREALVLGLRRLDGIYLADYQSRFGYSANDLAGDAIKRFTALGLLCLSEGQLCLTREGLLVSDALWPELL